MLAFFLKKNSIFVYMKKPAPKREPIKVSDPNDKRLRAYNDSNQTYKNFKEDVDYHKGLGYKFAGMNKVDKEKLEYKNPTFGSYVIKPEVKPVQPYVLAKSKPVAKSTPKPVLKTTPKPVAKPVEKPTAKPMVKEDKKMYQGRSFMDSTGLRPGNYTPTQIKEAVAKRKTK